MIYITLNTTYNEKEDSIFVKELDLTTHKVKNVNLQSINSRNFNIISVIGCKYSIFIIFCVNIKSGEDVNVDIIS